MPPEWRGGATEFPSPSDIDEDHMPTWLRASLEDFRLRHGKEAPLELLEAAGPIVTIRFSGQVFSSCCALDYFDDLKVLMEERSGSRFAIWEAVLNADPGKGSYDVKYARLSCLEEIRKAMDKVGGAVQRRMEEFRACGEDSGAQFEELCFCILTANYTAEGGARIQAAVGDGFEKLPPQELAMRLRALGHRFPNTRASFIVENRRLKSTLQETLRRLRDSMEAREWLVENVKGFGYKEASHFLRNTGRTDVAIIDRHVLRFLVKEGLIEEPRAMTRRRYLFIERLLRAMADELGISLAEMDLYLWYIMKGKVLK